MGYRLSEEQYRGPAQSNFIDLVTGSANRYAQMRQNEARAVAEALMRGGEATGGMYANVGQSLGQGIGKGIGKRAEDKRYSEEQAESKRRYDDQMAWERTKTFDAASEEAFARMDQKALAERNAKLAERQITNQEGAYADVKKGAARNTALENAKSTLQKAYAKGDEASIALANVALREAAMQGNPYITPADIAKIQNDALAEFKQKEAVNQLTLQQTDPYQESKGLLERTQLVSRATAELQDLAREYKKIGAIEGADSAKAREIEGKYVSLMRDLKAGGVAEDLGVKLGGAGGMFTTKREYMQKSVDDAIASNMRELEGIVANASAAAQRTPEYNRAVELLAQLKNLSGQGAFPGRYQIFNQAPSAPQPKMVNYYSEDVPARAAPPARGNIKPVRYTPGTSGAPSFRRQ